MNRAGETDPILDVVDEFMSRRQRGESPTIDEYCDRYPDLAHEIRDLFPTLELMEDLQPASEGVAEDPERNSDIPERIGDFDVIAEIGRGGMGIVYEAEQKSLGRRVALKVLPQSTRFGDSARVRFQREARAAAQMHHTNIVPVFEVGNDEGLFFYAMQLIQGQSLDQVINELSGSNEDFKAHSLKVNSTMNDDGESSASLSRIRSGSLSTGGRGSTGSSRRQYYRSAARITLQAAEALAYAHARGVVHRDIKPSNLILDADGVVWVTDFGLAKTDDEGMTQTGDFLGTLRYMSPERFKGAGDERADVYGLGLTLYELIVLRPAFAGTDRLKLIEAIGREDPPRPRSIDPRIPQDLETIVLKAIEKAPRARYKSAKELGNDLQRFMDDVPIRARRASVVERFFRWSRRNKALAGALTGILALAVILAAVSSVAWLRQTKLTAVAEHRSDELQRNLYFSEMNVAGQSASARFGVPTIRRQLSRWTPDKVGVDLRGWEWYYLHSMANRERFSTPRLDSWTWSVDYNPAGDEFVHCVNGWGIHVRSNETGDVVREKFLGSARYVDWSPDGTKIAVAGFNANVNVCDAKTLDVVIEIGDDRPQEVFCVKWSPDGEQLATCRKPQNESPSVIRIWNAGTGNLNQQLDAGLEHTTGLSWSPDGTRLISCGTQSLTVWDVATGKELHRTAEPVNAACWSPNADYFVIGHDRVEMKNAATGKTELLMATDKNLDIQSIDWRPGARQLACGHADGTVTLWDVDAGAQLNTLYGHTSAVSDLKWNQAGTQIVTSGMENTVKAWDVFGHDQTQVVAANTNRIEWSHDGEWIVGAAVWGTKVIIWNSKSNEVTQLVDGVYQVESVCVSPDNERVAFAGRMGMQVWDVVNGLAEVKDESYWYGWIDWHSDGKQIVTVDEFQPMLMLWSLEPQNRQDLKLQEYPAAVQWSPNGTRIAIAGREGKVVLRDASGNLLWSKSRPTACHAIRWCHDGSRFASSETGAIVIWDAENGDKLLTLGALSEDFGSIDWNSDSTRLASSSSSSVAIWDTESGHVATKMPGGGADCVRWNPDGKRLAAARGTQGIFIWDASRGYTANEEPSQP